MIWLFWALLFGSLVMLAAWRDALRAGGLAEEAAALAGAGARALRRRGNENAAQALLRLLGPLGRLARVGPDAEALLRQAGLQLAAPDFAALKASALVGLGAAGLAAGAALGSLALAALFAAAAAAAGNILPDWLLSSRAAARRAEIARGVPALVDVLAACAAAGLGIHEALKRVAPRLRGPLGAEVRRAVAEASAGATLREALESMARRAGVPEAERLAESLALAVRYGTPVADALGRLSEEMRAARRTRAEEFARGAEVRAVIPVAIFIFFPLLALMIAPVLMMLIQAFGAM